MTPPVTIVGGGLAGTEATFQLANAHIDVRLVEMKPTQQTPAHRSTSFGELVCSNSLRSTNPLNAVGLLKQEMQQLGSLVIQAAMTTRVPAGDALAVDRDRFAQLLTDTITSHPRVEIITQSVHELPPPDAGPTIIATGPLTTEELAESIVRQTGEDQLHFYDAIAPIVAAESIDRSIVFAGSRYGKGGGDDYLNAPLDRQQYETFREALLSAECAPLHAFENPKFFPGCLPVEVVAQQGPDTLRFGCMKPVGLVDPGTGRRPFAVVQLRQEDRDAQAFNLVGFQTKLRPSEQRRVFRTIPGLTGARFFRLGAVHRNTFLNSPVLLDHRARLRARPHLHFAGQITGVEGYVESAAHGLLVALMLARSLVGRPISLPPPETACGALLGHVRGDRRLPNRPFEPENINWAMFPPCPPEVPKRERKRARVDRAIAAFREWATSWGGPVSPEPGPPSCQN